VSDVVHLLAELIENATVFSASDTRVLVSVQELASGGVLIQVSDSGVGVSDTRLAEMNRRLDDPPPIDESISRHMGLYAVARLAERHGVRVRLRAGNPQGLTALVWLPDNVAERSGRQYGDVPQRLAAFEARRTPGQHAATGPAAVPSFGGPAPEPWVTGGQPEAFPEVTRTPTGPSRVLQPAGLAPGSASATWFRNRQATAMGAAEAHGQPAEAHGQPAEAFGQPPGPWPAAPQPESAWPAAPDGWASGQQAAQTAANPVRGDRTVAGMPVRVPHANLIPGSADGGQRTGSQRGASQPVASQGPASSGLPQRSAETARSRLSGFQRGARRAEDQASHAEMRTDR
jgi:Histidine kinase-, DNA gyrase B-, and HSP90-like ATPase